MDSDDSSSLLTATTCQRPRHSSPASPGVTGTDNQAMNKSAGAEDKTGFKESLNIRRCAWCGNELNVVGVVNAKVFDESVDVDSHSRLRYRSDDECAESICSTATFDERLKFCSRSCSSRYKMNLFCVETQQYLQQLQVTNKDEAKSSSEAGKLSAAINHDERILITPDLWSEVDPPARGTKRQCSASSARDDGRPPKAFDARHDHNTAADDDDDGNPARTSSRQPTSPAPGQSRSQSPRSNDNRRLVSSPGRRSAARNAVVGERQATRGRSQSRSGERHCDAEGKANKSRMTSVKSESATASQEYNSASTFVLNPAACLAGMDAADVAAWLPASLTGGNELSSALFNYPPWHATSWPFLSPPPPPPLTVPVTPLMMPPAAPQSSTPAASFGLPSASKLLGGTIWPGLGSGPGPGPAPPSTLLVPYPFPIPLPLPIPIPIPIPVPVPVPISADTAFGRPQPSKSSAVDCNEPPLTGDQLLNDDDNTADRQQQFQAPPQTDVRRSPTVDRSSSLMTHVSPKPGQRPQFVTPSPSSSYSALPCRSSPNSSNSISSSSDPSTTGVLDLSGGGCRPSCRSSPGGPSKDSRQRNQPVVLGGAESGGAGLPLYSRPQLALLPPISLPYLARRSLILDAPSFPKSDKGDRGSSPHSGGCGRGAAVRMRHASMAKRNLAVHRQRNKMAHIKAK